MLLIMQAVLLPCVERLKSLSWPRLWPYDAPHHNPFIERIDEAWAQRWFGSTGSLTKHYKPKLQRDGTAAAAKKAPIMDLTTLSENVEKGVYRTAFAASTKGVESSSQDLSLLADYNRMTDAFLVGKEGRFITSVVKYWHFLGDVLLF